MQPSNSNAAEVLIETRVLGTDRRERVIRHVEAPGSVGEEREQLERAVAEVEPLARLRSFADGAATFLAPRRLLIASYRRRPTVPPSIDEGQVVNGEPPEDCQKQLFD